MDNIFIAKPYSYFDIKGPCNFPSPDEVISAARKGMVTAMILDANVCLNIANYARGQRDKVQESMIRQFLLSVEFTKVDVVPFFGCMELAADRNSPVLDNDQLSSIASNVKAALDQSESSLALGYQVFKRPETQQKFESESIEAIYPMLRFAYACFLKIHEIRSRGHLKDRAVKNFIEFYDWCEALKCHVSLISQAAFALLGGSQDAQKLLTVTNDKTPLDSAWGAAWDTWYSWMIQNYLPSLPVDGVMQRAIFVTDDAAAAFVAGQCMPKAFFLNKGEPFLSASAISYNFPYFADKSDRLNAMLEERKIPRMLRLATEYGSATSFESGKVEEEIKRLEKIIIEIQVAVA